MNIAPELLFLAGEVAKKPEGWTVERWLTVGGFTLSVVLGIVTLLKFLKERSDSKEVKDAANLKAPAEKDVIIVTGAQSAVLMMEQAAKAARDEADRKQVELDRANAKINELEEKIKSRDDKIDELEAQLRQLQMELNAVTEKVKSLRTPEE
jgi:peptidoglycan hydrolase CwlO-like protein